MSWLLPSVRGYQRRWLRGDVIGGLAAGTVVIPQAMAYSTIAGLPVQIGLYTCMAPMIIYALLGGARALSVSTTSTIAVLVASTIAGLPDAAHRSAEDLQRAAFTLTFMVGICLLLMRLLRLGSLIEMISPATLTGIRVGVGLTVAASQLPALLGIASPPSDSGFFGKVAHAIDHLPQADLTTVLVAAAAIAVLLLLRRLAPTVPGPLVVVAAGILLVATTSIADRSDGHGLILIDHVPTGLPTPSIPVPGDVVSLMPGAMAIAVMAFMETVLVARTNRRRDEPQINVGQELTATGVASLGGGLTQSLPPAGGFSQSAVNLRAGARTQLAQLITAALAILVALFLAPLLDDLPKAILAAMVIVAVIGLLSPADFFRYARIDKAELWVAIVVGAIGLTGGMLLGVAVGVILTLALVVRQVNRARVRPLYPAANGGWTITEPPDQPEDDHQRRVPPEVVLLHLDGALYAGNTQITADAILRAARTSDDIRWVVLECVAVHAVTVPMVDILRDVAEDLERDGSTLILAGLGAQVRATMSRSQWFTQTERSGLVVPTVDAAIRLAAAGGPAQQLTDAAAEDQQRDAG
ncbi:STAS domain-containing protein [Microlunatus elymi]|uniref:STAS domain-containing protein n=1 Tax=Microlunatus elymi TaxID=2596828 RepID=A0A516Q079_9ACTN|nr:SulP family inorganic anion transporter [Microlunatus elymi]QDP96792.1 STAS domain-containing protein [Microlunatus elymi]